MTTYLCRLITDELSGEVVLYPIEDTRVVEVHEGDEFITIETTIPLFKDQDDNTN